MISEFSKDIESMNVLVRSMPEDVWRVIIREQAKEKEAKGISQYSMSSTIIKIIKEWEKCRKEGAK